VFVYHVECMGFCWLCGLKELFENLKDFLNKRLKRIKEK
jgi:hypothetical protein